MLGPYRALMRLLPRRFRDEHGAEMAAHAQALVDAEPGALARGSTIARLSIDLLANAPRLHHRERALARRDAATLPPESGPHTTDTRMRIALGRDARHALRGLSRAPGFALAAVLTLGLGIGAATTIFSVVNGVLMRPLPYDEPDRLVNIWNELGGGAQNLPAVSSADYVEYARETTLFEDFAAGSGGNTVGATGILTGNGEGPERVEVSAATANFFPLLGVRPFLGRTFTKEEEAWQGPKVVMLGYDLWKRRYGGDRELVGKNIEFDGVPHEVVGILPPGFRLLLPAEAFLIKNAPVWKPIQRNWADLPQRNFTDLTVFGRLKPGVTLEQAQAEMNAVAKRFRERYQVHTVSQLEIRVVPLHSDIVKGVRGALLLLFSAVGVVVLICCANVANLLLARANARERELSIRLALGASRRQVARQLLTESLVLALLGGLLGVVLARGAIAVLAWVQPPNLPRLDDVRVDPTVLLFAFGACVATAVLFGLAPAMQGSKSDVSQVLGGSRGSVGRGAQARLRSGLVVAEVALSLVLLVCGGLLVRSFFSLQQIRPGFDADRALTFGLALPIGKYGDNASRAVFWRELQDRLGALPGVEAVGGTSKLPLTGSGPLWPYAYNPETAEKWESVTSDGKLVTTDYFKATGTRLLAGRTFLPDDARPDGPNVIVIDETLAREAFPGTSAVGRQLQTDETGSEQPFATVVGVVEHQRIHDLARDVRAQIYRPYFGSGRALDWVVRTSGDPVALAPEVRRVIAEMDPNLPVNDMRPMRERVSDALGQARFTLVLMQMAAGMAMLLAAVGIYGVIAYSVAQRTKEFGVRMALGESPGGLRRSVVRQGARLVLAALAIGLVAAVPVTRSLAGMLHGVGPFDLLTFAAVGAFLAAVALLACWIPARRASRVDPMVALRAE